MAIFRSVVRENISNNSGSPTAVVSTGAITSGRYGVIIGISAVNKSANAQEVTVTLVKADTTRAVLCSRLPLAVNTGFELCGGNKYVLEAGDSITAYASTANSVDVTCSYMTESQGS